MKVSSEQLSEVDPMTTSMGDMRIFSGENLAAGGLMQVNLSGKASVDGSGGLSKNASLGIGLGAFAVVLVGAGLWINYRQKRRPAPVTGAVSATPNEDELLDSIVSLDEQYEQGNLDLDEYETRRAELKEELRRVRAED